MTSMQSIWQCMSPVKACWNGAHERTASVMATGGIVWQVRAASWSAVAIAGVLIPNASAAIIAPEKIRDYLLSPTHPIGRFKAAYFRDLGYEQDNWRQLEHDLRGLLIRDAQLAGDTKYGEKYFVTGELRGPMGRGAEIVAVWIILPGDNAPRFVTAYPKD